MKVCLDTHIIIWGIKEEATLGQEKMIQKAKAFLTWLDNEGIKGILPSPVITELLMHVPVEKHLEVMTILQKKFMIPSFDNAAAQCYAKIWSNKNDAGIIEKMKSELLVTRDVIKIDCQIVAIAVVQKASCIYSYDIKLKKFAEGIIEVKEMPELAKQLELI